MTKFWIVWSWVFLVWDICCAGVNLAQGDFVWTLLFLALAAVMVWCLRYWNGVKNRTDF